MFAVARHFDIPEAKKAFRLFVSWSVRFLVVGGRGGLLDRNYAQAAHKIASGQINSAKGLVTELNGIIPADRVFQEAFAEARVTQNTLARYYLRTLENQAKNEPEPELLPNEDQSIISLEHILPEHPDRNWPDLEPDLAHAHYKRIGNMILLQASQNSLAGNSPFATKKLVYQNSIYILTTNAADNEKWGVEEIVDRQRELAKLAVAAWSLKP
jgi:hypothetical protein